MSQLSDQELIQLVQEKLPEELTETELDQLRERLRVSAELRDTLLEQLHFEAYLNEALGKFEVCVDEIVAVGAGPSRNRLSGYWGWTAILLAALVLCSVLVVVWFLPQPKQQPAVAEDKVGKKVGETSPTDADQAAEEKQSASDTAGKTNPGSSAVAQSAPKPPDSGKPAIAQPAPIDPAKLWRKEFEAESFVRGNVHIDDKNMGKGIGVICADDAKPVFAEYELTVPQAGKYRMELRYAAKTQRPLKLLVNGQPALAGIARSTTKDWKPQAQGWFPGGEIELPAGQSVLRLESDPPPKQKRLGQFPAIDKLALTSSFAVTVPVSPDESAQPTIPWSQLANREVPPQPALEASYLPQGDQWGLRRDRLQQWLEPVPNAPHQFHESQHGELPLAGFDGLLKLRAPWPADAVLRLSPYDHFGLRLHFWNGDEGVSFQFSDRPAPWWGVYATTRKNGVPRPEQRVLIGSADGRMDPTLHGPVEIRFQAGTLVFSRGDLRLMTVPFAQPPRDVYFDGRGAFSGFAMYRGSPLPDEIFPTRPYAIRTEKPAQLQTARKVGNGGIVSSLPDGGLELTSEKTKEGSQVGIPLESSSLQEIILQVEGATPGTGIYLSGGSVQQFHRLGFCRETTTKATCLSWLRPSEQHVDIAYDIQNQIVPFTGQKQWLRLIIGVGSLKCWTSADGIHWGRAIDPLRYIRGGCVEFGLYALPGEEKRSITLRRVEVRELNALTAIVPDDLIDRVPNLPGDLEVEGWLENVLESQPPGLDSLQWRQACALKTLALGTSGELGKTLLAGLIADVIVRPVSPADRLQFLQDAALIADTWEHADGLGFADHYERLGERLIQEGQANPCRLTGQGLLQCPLWTMAPIKVPAESLARYELLRAMYKDDWEDVSRLCRWLRFWNKPSHPHYQPFHGRDNLRSLVDLAEAGVHRFTPDQKPASTTPFPNQETVSWRHPLIEQLSKEGYNVLAEFEAALSGDSYKDACQIVAAASSSGALGLLPDARDRRLLVSLSRAVSLAMREHPQLQKTMIAQFGPIGRVRVRQAMAEGNEAGIISATLQFTGTEAAAEAHAWLGDRALAVGSFVQAIGQYQQALPTASASLRAELQAKLRLVSALASRPKLAGEPVTTAVTFGDQRLESAQFEQLVADIRATRTREMGGDQVSTAADPFYLSNVPNPTGFEIGRRFPFDGAAGKNAGNTHYAGTDTTGREFTIRIAGDWLITSNRFQVTAYNLTTGEKKWTTGLKDEEGDAHSFPLMPMPPVIHGGRIYVRRLTRNGPELACLELATGKVIWTKRPGNHVISDPLVIQDDLFAFFVEEPQIGLLQVSLGNFDMETGEVVAQSMQMQLRDVWGTKVVCQAVAAGDKIVAAIGGSVLSCDLLGQPRWLRRQTWMPPVDHYGFFRQFRQPPLVADGRVYVVQPGVLSVEALELESGRQVWQQSWPELRRIVGVVNQQMIIETATGLHALRTDNGERVWSSTSPGLLEAQICGTPGGVMVARTIRLRNDQKRLTLAWLDPATGRETARFIVPAMQDKDPQAATLLPWKDRVWLAWGHQPRDFKREIVELVPKGTTQPGAGVDVALARWTSHVPVEVQEMVGEFLPGWTLLTRQNIQQAGHHPEFQGQQDLIQTQTSKEHPVIFARSVALSKDRPGKLRIQAGVPQGQPWQLAVRVNDQVLLTAKLDDQTPNRIGQYAIDLAPFAGQTVWLQVAQDSLNGGQATAFWKQLELVD